MRNNDASHKDFDLKKEIRFHAAWAVHDIHSRRKRAQIKKELSEHLEDAVHHHMLEGHAELEAFRIACEELGDPKKLQRLFAVVHNREPSRLMSRLTMLLFIAITAVMLYVIPQTDLPYTAQSWLILASQLICVILSVTFVVCEYKYIRAFCKRVRLIGRLKKLCKEKHFAYHCTADAYTDLDNTSVEPSFFVQVNGKTIAVRFTACLKKKDTYTFTDPSSYFTTNNASPILISFGYPVSGLVMKTPAEKRLYLSRIVTLRNSNYIKSETVKLDSELEKSTDTQNILCIHPLPVKVQVVRTNRAEDIFDGDTFNGYTVYSGNGLCNYLKQCQ